MERRAAAITVLAGTTVAVLFAAIATAGEVKLADGTPSFLDESPATAPVTTTPPVTIPPVDTSDVGRFELPSFVVVILQILFYGCVTIFAVLVLIYAWNHRPSLHWHRGRRRRAAEFDVLDDVVTAITADADAQREALRRGSPRNAIVECWLRLEAAVIAAGVRRDPADTSAELTQRVLANRHVDPEAIASLAALYREARFSDHAMGEDARRAAIGALDAVHDGLRSDVPTVATNA